MTFPIEVHFCKLVEIYVLKWTGVHAENAIAAMDAALSLTESDILEAMALAKEGYDRSYQYKSQPYQLVMSFYNYHCNREDNLWNTVYLHRKDRMTHETEDT